MSNSPLQWERAGNVVAWPYAWQRPNKTEEWAYTVCKSYHVKNHFIQFLFFPWATLIDQLRRGMIEESLPLRNALKAVPPRMTLRRATVMQHIWSEDMLQILQDIGITDVFWSHATKSQMNWDAISVHSFPLYPVNSGVMAVDGSNYENRGFLYSFVGAYDESVYLSQVRRWIFELPALSDAYVARRPSWHYEHEVYGCLNKIRIGADSEIAPEVIDQDFCNVMRQSMFALCPSGSGPNSIRLWEALMFGCIPVVIADSFRPPFSEQLWIDAVVLIPESKQGVNGIPRLLRELSMNPVLMNKKVAAARLLAKALVDPQQLYAPALGEFAKLVKKS